MSRLPQLRESLMVAAERQIRASQQHSSDALVRPEHAHRVGWLGRRRRVLAQRMPVLVLLLAGALGLAAVAYAATHLIETGAPVESEEGFNPNAGAGVAIGRTEGLLGIAAPDPAGGPPWTMRVYDTSRGLGCVQVGRLVGGRIGVLGQDGAFGDDGRFHPLPAQVSQAEGECALLDGHGHAFLGVGNYGVPASGLPHQCHLLSSISASERCGRGDPRDIFYGLLGPDARSITYTLDGKARTIPTVGSDGAYLFVERTPAKVISLGVGAGVASALPAGGGTLDGMKLPQPIRKVTYTHGRTCTIAQFAAHDKHGGDCLPPVGYAPQDVRLPSASELASAVKSEATSGRPPVGSLSSGLVRELAVSFFARVPVHSALSGYSVTLDAPDTGRCVGRPEQANAQVGRNVRAGERIRLVLSSGYADSGSLFPGCPGMAHGAVSYSVPSYEVSSGSSYGPFIRRHSGRVTVGHFGYKNAG